MSASAQIELEQDSLQMVLHVAQDSVMISNLAKSLGELTGRDVG